MKLVCGRRSPQETIEMGDFARVSGLVASSKRDREADPLRGAHPTKLLEQLDMNEE